MKSFYLFPGLLLLGAVVAAQPAPAPQTAAAAEPFTFTMEGTVAPAPAFKLVIPSDGHTVEASQWMMVDQPNDSELQLMGTLTAVKNGYRLDYTLTLRAPSITKPPGLSSSRPMLSNINTKASVILPLGRPVEISNTNGAPITMTLVQSPAK
jgi:hypothetical protein